MEKITHVLRQAPPWSTCKPITVCGNMAAAGDKSLEQMKQHIKDECRGSKKVAYATCCVNCLDNMEPWYSARLSVSPAGATLHDYLSKYGRDCEERKARIAIEVDVLSSILANTDFQAQVEKEVQQRKWRNKSKRKVADA